MITFSAPSHIRLTLLIIGFVCLATTCTSLLLVSANSNSESSLSGFKLVPSRQTFNNLSTSESANFAALSQSFVVTNANDAGTGSLREAILNANATPGHDTIVFNIPGPGVKLISPQTPLPEITETITIDATSQPGYTGAPLVEIDGAALVQTGSHGLVINASGSTVRGLAIGNFVGFGIELRSCDNNVIQSNYIGVDAAGTLLRPNHNGIRLSNSANNMIGGTTAAARNVISGNRSSGIHLDGSNNIVQGNFIGTNSAGTAPLDNSEGVLIIFGSSTNNLIGGLSAGAGNLISGNATGLDIRAPGNTVQGNLIGTDVTGTKRVRNGFGINSTAQNVLIGGLSPGARNIISGNGDGVSISGNGSKVQGNFIGTDITGTLALGNGANGVSASNNVLIGGTVPEARNVISANGDFRNNLFVGFHGPGVTVQGNYIGTDVTGTRALNTKSIGISVLGNNNLIGGTLSGAQNVISGNSTGIRIELLRSGNTIQGNLIGLNAQGTGPLPNAFAGIECSFNSSDNTIGGTAPGAGNKIAFNGGPGVRLSEVTRTVVRGNSIFSNGGLGIDLGTEGVTANDDNDADTGANNLQNFPVLTSVISAGNSTSIQGSLNSIPNATFQIDFYSNAAVDPSGNGEGTSFFGSASITTDSNGQANINATFPVSLGSHRVVTATATDADGNTSEFSAANATNATGNAQFSVGTTQVLEDIGLLNVTVLRKGGSTGNLTVEFATADGTAIAGQDYTSSSGTLTFSDGETSKSFQVQITDDATAELNETFVVLLRNASTLETLGSPAILVVTLEDSDTTPTLLVEVDSNSLLVLEGNTGSTKEVLFTIKLPAPSVRTVRVDFATEKRNTIGGASCSNQGTDFETTLGTLTFQPGSTSASFAIRVCGDSNAELDETFLVRLLNPVNATLDITGTIVRIIDDDVIVLLLDDPGSGNTQVAALDGILLLRDPFRVVGIPEWFPNAPDRNTRVIFFVRNLQLDPGELPSTVTVRLSSDLLQFQDAPADDVRPLPNTDLTQVTFRLPDNLPAGIYVVQIRARGHSSSTATIRIAP